MESFGSRQFRNFKADKKMERNKHRLQGLFLKLAFPCASRSVAMFVTRTVSVLASSLSLIAGFACNFGATSANAIRFGSLKKILFRPLR